MIRPPQSLSGSAIGSLNPQREKRIESTRKNNKQKFEIFIRVGFKLHLV